MWPMNCFGRSRCHLICITQEIRYHRTGHTINQQVWKPETLLNSSCLFVVFNYKSIPDACPFCCCFNLAIGGTQLQEIKETQHACTGNTHTDLLWSAIHNCIPDACLIHSRYQTGNPGRYLYDIGFLSVAGCLCQARFFWKLNLWKVWWCYVADELFRQKPVSLNLHNTRDQIS